MKHLLSHVEYQRLLRITDATNQSSYLIGKVMLKKLIATRLDIAANKITFKISPHGKPNLPYIKFNISHCREYIVICLADNEIGIDIEPLNNKIKLADELIAMACTNEELSFLQELDDATKNLHFLRLWVKKEAITKAQGLGLSYDFNKLEILDSYNKIISCLHSGNFCGWQLQEIYVKDHFCYIAVDDKKDANDLTKNITFIEE